MAHNANFNSTSDSLFESTPKLISAPSPTVLPEIISAVCGNEFTALLDANGKVWTFGCNEVGQCGHGGGEVGKVQQLENLSHVESIAASNGSEHIVAITGR